MVFSVTHCVDLWSVCLEVPPLSEYKLLGEISGYT